MLLLIGALIVMSVLVDASDDGLGDDESDVIVIEYDVVMEDSPERFLTLDAFVRIGGDILAFILFIVAAIAYYRDRRLKFLTLSLAFLLFTIKRFLGLMDLLYPQKWSYLLPFTDEFDFIILLLFLFTVFKD